MSNERYELGAGRPRPPYQPKNIKCTACGAGLTIKDEHTELVVCDYCGSHLDVTREEKKVLGKGPAERWDFPLNIGDSFVLKGARYEVLARLAFIEDGDYDELSREYMLYNPRHGSMWLGEYKGHYSITTPTHVAPKSDPFDKRRGDVIETHDGKEWTTEGTGEYQLAYVDGALPWIAQVGDRIHYAEFVDKKGSGQQYEVQRIRDEIEYGSGRSISLDLVKRATGKDDIDADIKTEKVTDVAGTRKQFVRLIWVAVIVLVLNGVLGTAMKMKGDEVLRQKFTSGELTGEAFTDTFNVSKDGNIIKITVTSEPRLSNAWMAFNFAIVQSDEEVVHVGDQNISYYHGKSGGESWSEGSNTSSSYVKIPKAGSYKLLLHAVSATGNTSTSSRALHGCYVRIKDGVLVSKYFFAMFIFSIFALFFVFIIYSIWKGQADD